MNGKMVDAFVFVNERISCSRAIAYRITGNEHYSKRFDKYMIYETEPKPHFGN